MRIVALAMIATLALAGCYTETTTGADDDLKMTASNDPHDGGWDLAASVEHEGTDRDYDYRKGCDHEWDWRILDAGGTEVPLGQVTCEGFTEAVLEPGDRVEFSYFWDGTRWDSESGTYEQAPPGTYTFEVAFVYWERDEPESVGLSISFEKTA